MSQLGFTDIYTIESLRRVLCVKKYGIPEFDFEHDVRDHKRSSDLAEKNEGEIEDKEEDEEIKTEPIDADKQTKIKINFKRNNKSRNQRNKEKKRKSDRDENNSDSDESDEESDAGPAKCQYAAKAINMQPGHTGFLTFATLLHKEYQKF